jgi:hypothetical protein
VNPNVQTVLRPEINRLEHTVVSQDVVIACLTQELSDLSPRPESLKLLQVRDYLIPNQIELAKKQSACRLSWVP